MTGTWVCGDCRSVNNERQKRCYSCYAPRATAELTAAAASVSTPSARRDITIEERAGRIGARYKPSWLLALLVVPAIVATTILDVQLDQLVASGIDAEGPFIEDPLRVQKAVDLLGLAQAVFAVSILVWSVWIAVVASNVPALTARWPKYGPIGAFFGAWIPIVNLVRPYKVVRDLLNTLTGGKVAPLLLALFWWLALIGSAVVPLYVVLALNTGDTATPLASVPVFSQVRIGFIVLAAILAIFVVLAVEREQFIALRRRRTAIVPKDLPRS